jgi:hypothetical protein
MTGLRNSNGSKDRQTEDRQPRISRGLGGTSANDAGTQSSCRYRDPHRVPARFRGLELATPDAVKVQRRTRPPSFRPVPPWRVPPRSSPASAAARAAVCQCVNDRVTAFGHNVRMSGQNILTLRRADQARTDFALIESNLEFLAGQLARVPAGQRHGRVRRQADQCRATTRPAYSDGCRSRPCRIGGLIWQDHILAGPIGIRPISESGSPAAALGEGCR